MASGHQAFASSTEKTLSYKQLKTNYHNILKEHEDCKTKLGKQQSSLHNAKSARKRLEKEIQELKGQLTEKDSKHKEILEEVSQKLEMTNSHLGNKVDTYERRLEKLGVDPVSLKTVDYDDEAEKENKRKGNKYKVDSLITNLTENIERGEVLFDQLQNILDQCNAANEDLAPPKT